MNRIFALAGGLAMSVAMIAQPLVPAAHAEDAKKAAMIVQIPIGDPFLTSAFAGLKRLQEEHGVEVTAIEALDKSEHAEQVRAMAELGYSPIYAVWDDLANAAIELAPEFPDTKFVLTDTFVETDLPNIQTLSVDPQQSAYIAGYIAAKTSKANHIAWVGGMDNPTINKYWEGFEPGAKAANPSVKIERVYVGNMQDPAKGKEVASLLASQGVDVIMQSANQAGLGVIKGAEEAGIAVIGADSWQSPISDAVIWSALKDITGAVYAVGKGVTVDNSFQPGMNTYGAGKVALYDERDLAKLSPELQAEVKQIEADLASGKIVLK